LKTMLGKRMVLEIFELSPTHEKSSTYHQNSTAPLIRARRVASLQVGVLGFMRDLRISVTVI